MSSHFISSHYGGSHYASSHYGRLAVVEPDFTPEPVYPPGIGRKRQIIREDEEIMAIIVAFLHMQGR